MGLNVFNSDILVDHDLQREVYKTSSSCQHIFYLESLSVKKKWRGIKSSIVLNESGKNEKPVAVE